MRHWILLGALATAGCADVRKPTARAASELDSDSPSAERTSSSSRSSQKQHPPKSAADSSEEPTAGREQRGLASYYGDSLAGNKTASGERYNPKQLTAAHRTLKFQTWVLVTRADGRSVRVRITDRGPFVKGRIIDLSRAAAAELGMLREGVIEVKLRVMD